MNKQFINGVLETLRDDKRQICKQAAHIIGELAEEIERLDKAAKDKYEYHAELIGKWAGECEDKDDEIDSLQSLNDFQQQQIRCMQSDIEKMKCCGNCDNLWQEECSLSPESKNKCLENKSYLLWELKK